MRNNSLASFATLLLLAVSSQAMPETRAGASSTPGATATFVDAAETATKDDLISSSKYAEAASKDTAGIHLWEDLQLHDIEEKSVGAEH